MPISVSNAELTENALTPAMGDDLRPWMRWAHLLSKSKRIHLKRITALVLRRFFNIFEKISRIHLKSFVFSNLSCLDALDAQEIDEIGKTHIHAHVQSRTRTEFPKLSDSCASSASRQLKLCYLKHLRWMRDIFACLPKITRKMFLENNLRWMRLLFESKCAQRIQCDSEHLPDGWQRVAIREMARYVHDTRKS